MKKRKSLANRNIIILILSIMPFFIGLSLSVYNTSDTEYFSSAINVAGSQRMRTMLISNYLQAYTHAIENGYDQEIDYYKTILEREISKYDRFYDSLKYGDEDLLLKANKFDDIKIGLNIFQESFDDYTLSALRALDNPEDEKSYRYVINNAMKLKDSFDVVTALYQSQNDIYIETQKNIDISMIFFGALITIIGVVLSIKIREKEYHANFDYLTKIKNRHSLFEDIKELDITKSSMFFIDLNKFKVLNDTFGHLIGDEVLVEVTSRLRTVFGSENLYRYGGDEFIAILEDDKQVLVKDNIVEKVKEVKRMLSEPIIDSFKRNHYAGLAIGIMSSEVGVIDWHQLINLSDDLMYDSKAVAGSVIICNTSEELEERVRFADIVDKLIDENSIKFKAQAIQSICNDEILIYNITSVWENDEVNLSALEFLPILRRKGYLTEIDKGAFAYIENKYNNNLTSDPNYNKNIKYSVNLSEETLRNYKTNGLFSVLEKIEMPKELIIIKIHEGLLDYAEIRKVLNKIKNFGFKLAIDNIVLDVSLQNSDKYENVDIIKMGNTLSNALLEKAETKRIMIEFIRMFLSTNKTIIIEGVDRKDLGVIINSECDKNSSERVLYSRRLD